MKKIIQRKREIADFYKKKLSGLKHVSLLRQEPWARSICWMFGIIVSEKSGMDARALAQKLKKEGVETRPFFLGMHEQPVLKKLGFFKGERYPTTEFLARQGLYLPSGLNLTSAQMIRVCDGVRRILS
jgi:perosamine synthetase